jgi:DNA processing protein
VSAVLPADVHGSSPAAGEAALLAGLPGMGPRRLAAILDAWSPVEAWARATSGDARRLEPPGGGPLVLDRHGAVDHAVLRSWRAAAAGADPAVVLARHEALGVRVLLRDHAAYPPALLGDMEPPAVLFVRGDLRCLDGPRVAIVGTRRCTGTGAGMARELGHDLAGSGVGIVSGLALGIDGAAHRGVLQALDREAGGAPPIGVVGSGLDTVYPARHRELWASVAHLGVLLSEAAVGARPTAWRFPARNRVIAALADIVVVVESHAAGGSLHTVTEALRRDIPVMAVPGSVRSPAAAGTNQLLAEGCHPVRDATDVLVALGLTPAGRRPRADRRLAPDTAGQAVLAAFDWEPATLEHLAVRTTLPLATLAVALERLVATGWVSVQGGWYERVASP